MGVTLFRLVQSLDEPNTDRDAARELGRDDTSMLGALDRLNLKRAIRRLPSGCKRFFLLHVIGFKHREIARRLRCTVGCSKSQVHKARKRLQRLLGEQGHMQNDTASAWGSTELTQNWRSGRLDSAVSRSSRSN